MKALMKHSVWTVVDLQKCHFRTSLAAQWLRLRASTARGVGSIPDWGTKILHASRRSQKKKVISSFTSDITVVTEEGPEVPGVSLPKVNSGQGQARQMGGQSEEVEGRQAWGS